jgi:hypothetical protein
MEDCSRKEWDYKKHSGILLRGYYQLYPTETVLCNRIYFKPSLQHPNPPYIVIFLCCLVLSVISIYLWIILLCKSKCCNEHIESLRNHQRRPRIQYIHNPVHQHFHFHIEIPSNHNSNIIQSLQEKKSSRKIPSHEDSICCISLETIEDKEQYIHCQTCHKNFIAESLIEWLQVNPQCPHCRTMLTQESFQLFQNQE